MPRYTDATITKDIRQYLASRFTKNSVDSELQHQIRENLHTRIVPGMYVHILLYMYLDVCEQCALLILCTYDICMWMCM